MTRLSLTLIVSLLASLVTACASHARHESVPTRNATGSNMLVTAQELGKILHPTSLLDALERVRPSMLRSRGRAPMVSIDGSPPAELALLRSISVSSVREVRMVRSAWSAGHAAVTPRGDTVVGDLILVFTWAAAR